MEVAPLLALASAGVLGLLGLALLAASPRRPGSVVFAAFLVLWSANLGIFNSLRIFDLTPEAVERFALLGLATQIPLVLFLVHFAWAFPRGGAGFPWPTVLAGAVAVAGSLLLAVRPALFVEGLVGVDDGVLPAYGLGAVFLVFLPSFGGFFAATLVVLGKYLREDDAFARRELGVILAAFVLVSGYTATFQLVYTLRHWDAIAGGGAYVPVAMAALFVAGAAAVAVVAVRLALRLARGTAPARRPADRRILLAAVGATALAALGWLPALRGGAPVEFLGIVRIAAAGIVLYGILRHQLFGLDLGAKRAARVGFPFVVAFAIDLAASILVPFVWADGGALAEAASTTLAIGVGVLVAPLRRRAADRLFPQVVEGDAAYLHARALEVYRAALARSPAPDERELRHLRKTLGVAPDEDRVLRTLVRLETKPAAVAAARYERLRLLGQGGAGRVWLARDRERGGDVVLKEFPGMPGEHVLVEARATGAAQSPHVVRVLDTVEQEGRAFLVLEYVDGGSLEDRLAREGRLPADEALAIVADVLRGLAAVHAAGFVHRDVKPANILVGKDGRARLGDLGLAARPTATADRGATRVAGLDAGTLAYLSPEQAGGRGFDARSDLYAVTAVLYRAIAGRFYVDFGDAGEYHARRLILEAPPRLPLRGEEEPINALLARGLAKDPSARFPDAAAMLAAVEGMRLRPDPSAIVAT